MKVYLIYRRTKFHDGNWHDELIEAYKDIHEAISTCEIKNNFNTRSSVECVWKAIDVV
jgi:hypothetical protein